MSDITFKQGEAGGEKGLIADQRVYETADGRIVPEGDPEAVSLVAGAGTVIDPRTVQRLRLSEKGQEQARTGPGEPVPSTAADQPQPAQQPPPAEESEEKRGERGGEGGSALTPHSSPLTPPEGGKSRK